MKHTKLPHTAVSDWKEPAQNADGRIIAIDHPDGIIEFYGANRAENAQFVYRIASQHEQLVEALKEAKDYLERNNLTLATSKAQAALDACEVG